MQPRLSKLNPHAAPFVPHQLLPSQEGLDSVLYSYTYNPEIEEAVTSEELEELEACEVWCEQMAELAECEREHLISLALSAAPPEQIMEVELKHLEMDPSDKGSHCKGGKKSAKQHKN